MVAFRRPPTYYTEESGLINYWRRDGQRPLLYTDAPDAFRRDVFINFLRAYDNRQFIDYIIHSYFHNLFSAVAKEFGIPSLDYEGDGLGGKLSRLMLQFVAAQPTCAALFYIDVTTPNSKEFIQLCEIHRIPIETIRW